MAGNSVRCQREKGRRGHRRLPGRSREGHYVQRVRIMWNTCTSEEQGNIQYDSGPECGDMWAIDPW